MKKVAWLASLLILITTLAGCTSENSSSTNECWKEIYETSDSPVGGVIDSNTTFHYDDVGNLILVEELLWDGGIGERTTYTYDTMSNLLEKYRTWDGEFEKITYAYDSDGNLITESDQDSYTFTDDFTDTMTYDSSGNLLTVVRELSDGSIESRDTYIRDNDGLLLEKHSDSDGDGHYEERDLYHYNDEEQNTRVDTYDDSDTLTGYMVYTYHSNGELLSLKSDFDNDGRYDYDFTYSFDELDRVESATNIFDSEYEVLRMTFTYEFEYVGDTHDISYLVINQFDGAGDLEEVNTTYYGCID